MQVLTECFRSLNSTSAVATGREEQEGKSDKGPARVPAAARHTTVTHGLACGEQGSDGEALESLWEESGGFS